MSRRSGNDPVLDALLVFMLVAFMVALVLTPWAQQ